MNPYLLITLTETVAPAPSGENYPGEHRSSEFLWGVDATSEDGSFVPELGVALFPTLRSDCFLPSKDLEKAFEGMDAFEVERCNETPMAITYQENGFEEKQYFTKVSPSNGADEMDACKEEAVAVVSQFAAEHPKYTPSIALWELPEEDGEIEITPIEIGA